ncbi:MAG: hypothetical protein ABIG39_05260 [Candidatus Micrarchaeota archaeon]
MEYATKGNTVVLVFGLLILFLIFVLLIPCGPLSICEPLPPDVCTMPAGMSCTKSYLPSETDNLEVTIVNGLQNTIVITNMSCSKNPNQIEDINDVTMKLGESHEFITRCNDENGISIDLEQGEAFSGRINVQYYFEDEGPDNLRKISGNIYVKAA